MLRTSWKITWIKKKKKNYFALHGWFETTTRVCSNSTCRCHQILCGYVNEEDIDELNTNSSTRNVKVHQIVIQEVEVNVGLESLTV